MNTQPTAEEIAIKHIGEKYWESWAGWKKGAVINGITEASSLPTQDFIPLAVKITDAVNDIIQSGGSVSQINDTVIKLLKSSLPTQPSINQEFENGFFLACQMVDEMYSKSSTHKYMIGDCLLAKRNKLSKENIRLNPQAFTTCEPCASKQPGEVSEEWALKFWQFLCDNIETTKAGEKAKIMSWINNNPPPPAVSEINWKERHQMQEMMRGREVSEEWKEDLLKDTKYVDLEELTFGGGDRYYRGYEVRKIITTLQSRLSALTDELNTLKGKI